MDDVQQRFTLDVDARPERVFPLVADLTYYEQLLEIVHQVVPEDVPEPAAPAWTVTLRAKLGPFARSKRLRMERTAYEPDSLVRFERTERDGRDHSPWTLEATTSSLDGGSRITMALDYGGRLWTGALDGVLESQVAKARDNLEILAAEHA